MLLLLMPYPKRHQGRFTFSRVADATLVRGSNQCPARSRHIQHCRGARGIPKDIARIAALYEGPLAVVVARASTTNTARSFAGSVSLALALTAWRSPGSSDQLCPALSIATGPSFT